MAVGLLGAPPATSALETIDFETLAGGTCDASGDIEVSAGACGSVFLRGFNPALGAVNAACIYDSDCPGGCTGGDDDLGSPNQTCPGGGPGIGADGEFGEPNENCTALGKLAAVCTVLTDPEMDGICSNPNDAAAVGTSLTLDFSAIGPVTVHELTIIVIGYKLVAAAIRRPARVIGDGASTIRELIERQSRRRAAATGGESKIPLDAETERCVAKAGFGLDDVPPSGQEINVRKAANLHTGGTIHDVTAEVHPSLVDAAIRAARALDVPVTGIDFMVRSPRQPGYWFIEANERPGLANHEPQPTAERFIDLLFPQSMPTAVKQAVR
jgi:hypothetical protein